MKKLPDGEQKQVSSFKARMQDTLKEVMRDALKEVDDMNDKFNLHRIPTEDLDLSNSFTTEALKHDMLTIASKKQNTALQSMIQHVNKQISDDKSEDLSNESASEPHSYNRHMESSEPIDKSLVNMQVLHSEEENHSWVDIHLNKDDKTNRDVKTETYATYESYANETTTVDTIPNENHIDQNVFGEEYAASAEEKNLIAAEKDRKDSEKYASQTQIEQAEILKPANEISEHQNEQSNAKLQIIIGDWYVAAVEKENKPSRNIQIGRLAKILYDDEGLPALRLPAHGNLDKVETKLTMNDRGQFVAYCGQKKEAVLIDQNSQKLIWRQAIRGKIYKIKYSKNPPTKKFPIGIWHITAIGMNNNSTGNIQLGRVVEISYEVSSGISILRIPASEHGTLKALESTLTLNDSGQVVAFGGTKKEARLIHQSSEKLIWQQRIDGREVNTEYSKEPKHLYEHHKKNLLNTFEQKVIAQQHSDADVNQLHDDAHELNRQSKMMFFKKEINSYAKNEEVATESNDFDNHFLREDYDHLKAEIENLKTERKHLKYDVGDLEYELKETRVKFEEIKRNFVSTIMQLEEENDALSKTIRSLKEELKQDESDDDHSAASLHSYEEEHAEENDSDETILVSKGADDDSAASVDSYEEQSEENEAGIAFELRKKIKNRQEESFQKKLKALLVENRLKMHLGRTDRKELRPEFDLTAKRLEMLLKENFQLRKLLKKANAAGDTSKNMEIETRKYD